MSDTLSTRLLDYFRAVHLHSPSGSTREAPLADSIRDFMLVPGGDKWLEPGQVLFMQGDVADHLYWIEEGLLAVLSGDLVDPKLLAFRRPGQVVGEIALIENIRRTASIVAIERTRIRTLSREKFEAMLTLIPAIGIEIRRMLSARLRLAMPGDYAAGIHDPLTGALTREHFAKHLYEEIEVSCMYGQSFSMVFMDIDQLKSVNEKQGHAYGDLLLKTFVQTLRSVMRGTDLLFRHGGDEFVLLLPSNDAAQAASLTERLMEGVKADMESLWPPATVTFSAGVASYPFDGGTAEQILAVADGRLKQAKRQGPGKLVVQ
jgi:diguanylate cyclase (GGDEF)-like protein